jgi:hypothetical protein
MKPDPTQRLIWASRRELLNIFHADSSGCQVVGQGFERLMGLYPKTKRTPSECPNGPDAWSA